MALNDRSLERHDVSPVLATSAIDAASVVRSARRMEADARTAYSRFRARLYV